MNCRYCHSVLEEDALVCPICGRAVAPAPGEAIEKKPTFGLITNAADSANTEKKSSFGIIRNAGSPSMENRHKSEESKPRFGIIGVPEEKESSPTEDDSLDYEAEIHCADCGAVCREGQQYCDHCGAAVNPEADSVNSSREAVSMRKRAKSAIGKKAHSSVWETVLAVVLLVTLLVGFSFCVALSLNRSGQYPAYPMSQVTEDGILAIRLETEAKALSFEEGNRSSITLRIENNSPETVSGLTIRVNYPKGFAPESGNKVIAADRIGPGAAKSIPISVVRQDGIRVNFWKIVAITAASMLLSFLLLKLFAALRKHNQRVFNRAMAYALAFALLLPHVSAFAEFVQRSEGRGTLLYDPEDGLARCISVPVTSKGSFPLGRESLGLETNYTVEQRILIETRQENGMLHFQWNSISGAKTYTVYQSWDNQDYFVLDSVSEHEYTMSMPYGPQAVYYRVSASTGSGELYSESLRIIILDDGRVSTDADCDYLPDDLEVAFGTSASLDDTDGDGLTDYYEVVYTLTDPLEFDTGSIGLSDGEKDLDGDRLTNAQEAEFGTNPRNSDSDGDGLEDAFEIQQLGTSPVNPDTDGDGLWDGTEYRISSDPLRADSVQSGGIDLYNSFDTTLTDDAHSGASLTVSDSGLGLSIAELSEITDQTTLQELPYLAGPVVSVQVSDTGQGTITLPVTRPQTGGGELAIAVYDPENGDFHLLDNSRVSPDGSSVSAPLSQEYSLPAEPISDNGETVSGKRQFYCVFYVANWHMQFNSPLAPGRGDASFDVEFVIDESSSMEDYNASYTNDPERYRVYAAKTFASQLLPGDRAAVVGFNGGARRKLNLSDDMDEVRAAIDEIVGDAGGTALYNGLFDALDELLENEDPQRGRFIIALTDGEDSYSPGRSYDQIIETCVQHRIPIYTIALGPDVNANLLSKLATYTGGAFFHIRSAEDLPQAFNRIQNNAFYGVDTDGDGLSDDVENYGLRDGAGKVYYTDSQLRFTDNDDMSDGEEAGNVMYCQIAADGSTIQYYVMLSDPTRGDTDGDGIDDLDERLIGTLPWCSDTDGDGLDDGFELSIGYNPLEANVDGDSFDDGVEYAKSTSMTEFWSKLENNSTGNSPMELLLAVIMASAGEMDPYSYDLDTSEKVISFLEGAVLGDFGDLLADLGLVDHNMTDSFYYTLGSAVLDMIPAANVVVSIRDACANLLEGDLVGMAFSLVGLIPETGSAVKVTKKILDALSSSRDFVSEYAGSLQIRKIANSPAITYIILRAIRMLEEKFSINLDTSKVDSLINSQIRAGNLGLTKEAARNFELFITFGGRYSPNYSSDCVDAAQTIQLTLRNTASFMEQSAAVRQSLGTAPGGTIRYDSGKPVYTLVRTFDLETSEYGNSDTLDLALQDAVDRAAGYYDLSQPNLEKRLIVAIPDCLVSSAVDDVLSKIGRYARNEDVDLQFCIYLTADDTSYDEDLYRTQPSDKKEAILIMPGITGSELIAQEEYRGSGKSGRVKAGDTVWLPLQLRYVQDALNDLVAIRVEQLPGDLALELSYVIESLSMLQMNEKGKALYKLTGMPVSSDAESAGTLDTGTAVYQALRSAFGDSKDVVFYSYDWRDPVDEAARDLETYINLRGYEKVTFVCHSMGGVVTSCYLARSEENIRRTEKVVTVGTPYGGAPKALLTLQTGKFVDFTCLDGTLRALAYNIPAVYDLLPYRNMVQYFGSYILDNNNAPISPNRIETWLTNEAVSGPEAMPKAGINPYLYQRAQSVENMLYAGGRHVMNRSDLDAYIIAGYDTLTITTVTERDNKPVYIGKSLAGDGTVPLASAVMTNGYPFQHPIYYVKGINHSDLIQDEDVIRLIVSILSAQPGQSIPVDGSKICTDLDALGLIRGETESDDVKDALDSKIVTKFYNLFVAFCPVTLSLWDPDGNLVGVIGSNGISAKEGYEEFFDLLDGGETKQIIVPEGYSVTVDGTDTGNMDLDIVTTDQNGMPQRALCFNGISVGKETNITAQMEDREKLSGVKLRVTGIGGSYELTDQNAKSISFETEKGKPEQERLERWILIGVWVALMLSTLIAMRVIVWRTRPGKKAKR